MELPQLDGADAGPGRDPNLVTPGGIRVLDLGLEAMDLALSTGPVRTGRTIARLASLRLTMMSLKAHATVKQHKTEHEISIQVISGAVVLHTARGRLGLHAGQVAVVERDTMHEIVAQADSSILITVAM